MLTKTAWRSSSASSRARTSTRYDLLRLCDRQLGTNSAQLISSGSEKLASVPSGGGGGGAAGGAAAGGAAPAEEAKAEEKEEEKEESDEDMGFGLFD
jgi:large subunit ribosomal protein LP2